MDEVPARPRVFLDVSIADEPVGRLVIELFADKAPITCENFRVLCTGEKPGLSYKNCVFHRVIDEFMVQGGDITKGDGTGGMSIYGPTFEDENIGWREIDAPGLVCMANRGKDTNNSQFFITLVPTPHLNAKHTVFGRLLPKTADVLTRIASVGVDSDDRPRSPITVTHCGELEHCTSAPKRPALSHTHSVTMLDVDSRAHAHSHSHEPSRGRKKRRHSSSPEHSRSRSRSPSRGHARGSASGHRHRRRRRSGSPSRGYSRSASDSRERPDPKTANDELDEEDAVHERPYVSDRRRSDAMKDDTRRGRARKRSLSRDRRENNGTKAGNGTERREDALTPRKRSPPPSRPHSQSPDFRRQKSLPNMYRKYEDGRRKNWGRNRLDENRGRLGAFDDEDWGGGNENGSGDGIIYKGRGKYAVSGEEMVKFRLKLWNKKRSCCSVLLRSARYPSDC